MQSYEPAQYTLALHQCRCCCYNSAFLSCIPAPSGKLQNIVEHCEYWCRQLSWNVEYCKTTCHCLWISGINLFCYNFRVGSKFFLVISHLTSRTFTAVFKTWTNSFSVLQLFCECTHVVGDSPVTIIFPYMDAALASSFHIFFSQLLMCELPR